MTPKLHHRRQSQVARLRAGVTGSFARAGPGNCENSRSGTNIIGPTVQCISLPDSTDADAKLERFVLNCTSDNDEKLIRHFHTRQCRRLRHIADYPSPKISRRPEMITAI